MLTDCLFRWCLPVRFDFAAEADEPEEAELPFPEAPPGPAGGARPGFRRNALGHLFLVLAGIVPLVLMVVFLLRSGQGLSLAMALFLFFYTVGYGICVQQLLFALRLPPSQFVPFALRSFYGLPELLAVAVVLVPMGLWNLVQSHGGLGLSLSRAGTSTGFGQSPLFLGGALWGTLGYSLVVGIAGLIVAVFRPFPVPLGNKVLAIPYRMLVGLATGGTIGFLLGVSITLPLYLAVLARGLSDPTLEVVVSAFGAARLPDLAFTYGFSFSALAVPLVMLVVGKLGPAGRSVDEEELTQHYTTTVAVPTTPLEALTAIPPVAVSFAEGAGPGEEEMPAGAFHFSPIGHPEAPAEEVDEDELARELLAELDAEMKEVINEALSAEEIQGTSLKTAAVPPPQQDPRLAAAAAKALGPLGEVTVPIEIEFGKATIALSDWINLMEGQLLKLDKPVSDSVNILISRRRVGTGQLSQVGDKRAVIVSHIDVAQFLKGMK